MPEQTNNEIIKYFCQELPDRHNLLRWSAVMYRAGEVFRHPEGLMCQILMFEAVGQFPLHHVMVVGMN